MATGQYNDWDLWIPFTKCEYNMQYEPVSMGQLNAWGLWIPYPQQQVHGGERGLYLDTATLQQVHEEERGIYLDAANQNLNILTLPSPVSH